MALPIASTATTIVGHDPLKSQLLGGESWGINSSKPSHIVAAGPVVG